MSTVLFWNISVFGGRSVKDREVLGEAEERKAWQKTEDTCVDNQDVVNIIWEMVPEVRSLFSQNVLCFPPLPLRKVH